MTSKTFKSVWNERTRLVHVMPVAEGVNIQVSDAVWNGQYGSTIAPSDAPALALAVLEAAGYEERQKGWDVRNSADENIAQAMRYLSKGIEIQKRTTAEAKEQAELEAEAVELFNANHGTNRTDWDHADRSVISSWVRVARRAREMSNEKKEPTND